MRNLLFTGLIFLAACQPQVFLMPTPEALRDPDFNLFEASPEPLATNTLNTLYATTREPADRGASHFTARKGDQLHIGYANVMVGDEGTELSSLIAQSTTEDRGQKFAIRVSGCWRSGMLETSPAAAIPAINVCPVAAVLKNPRVRENRDERMRRDTEDFMMTTSVYRIRCRTCRPVPRGRSSRRQ